MFLTRCSSWRARLICRHGMFRLILQEISPTIGCSLMGGWQLSVIMEVSLQNVHCIAEVSGAGTTAIGLRNGIPTIVVPFFGDQK